ncbi:11623_t:CDS:2 [Entrophospora sp. SA101]|nr:11623_t:CDS:2 [Entrophospora sp. SA101]
MENLPSEFLIQVYTYNKTPISLILVNKHIYKLFTSPLAKAKWALGTFGKTHALFHAIRLGKTFITVDVIKALLKLKANFSRYLVQICFAERSTQQTECNVLCGIYPKISWFSEMSLEAYITLINEGTSRFGTDAHLNTNDAKMFSFLSGQLLPDDQASILIKKNLKVIEDLIVNKEFTPFPPRPKVSNDKKNILARDDSEFRMVARAIILEPKILHMWKRIGYDIRKDVNDLVMQGCILKLLPRNPPIGWHNPDKKDVINRLNTFISIGFKLTKSSMVDILHLYENQPRICGSILMESFREVRKESKFVTEQKCLIEITRIDRRINYKVLDFLKHKGTSELEFLFLKTFIYHFFTTDIKKEFDNLETSFIKDEQVKSSNKNNSNDNQHLFVYDFKKETFTDMLKNYISSCIKKPTDGLTLKSTLYNPGKWFRELEKEHNNTSKATTSSDTFINLFNMFWKRINEETSLLNLSEK